MTPTNDSRPRRPAVAPRFLNLAARVEPLIFWLLAALLCLVFILGGASRGSELSILAMELLGVLVLALAIWRLNRRGTPSATWLPLALLAAVMLTPLLQLAPLPPQLWLSLPGRAEAAETLRLAQVTPGWAPLSLTPENTYRSFLWLLPPAAVFAATLGMDARRRLWAVGVVLGLCAASLLLAGLQLSDRDGGAFHIYDTSHSFLPVGFFANRNHQGVLMAAGLPLAAAFAAAWGSGSSERRKPANLVYVGLVGLLVVGILVTRSRAALILAGPALIASFVIFWMAVQGGGRRREVALAVGGAVALMVVAAQVAIGAVLSRFEDAADREGRFDIWPVIVDEGARVQFWGTGLGSFEAVYRSAEPLDLLTPLFVNHAHNDYLELWLEAGIVFPLLFAAFLIWFARATLNSWRRPSSSLEGILGRAASVVVLLLLLHSIGDYPLRTLPLACLFALAAGLMTPAAFASPGEVSRAPRAAPRIRGTARSHSKRQKS